MEFGTQQQTAGYRLPHEVLLIWSIVPGELTADESTGMVVECDTRGNEAKTVAIREDILDFSRRCQTVQTV